MWILTPNFYNTIFYIKSVNHKILIPPVLTEGSATDSGKEQNEWREPSEILMGRLYLRNYDIEQLSVIPHLSTNS